MKNWFITGVFAGPRKGVGGGCAGSGDTVVGTVREEEPEISKGRGGFHCLSLEMRDPTAIETTVSKRFELAGHLDVIVNNAGYGLLSPMKMHRCGDVSTVRSNVFGPCA